MFFYFKYRATLAKLNHLRRIMASINEKLDALTKAVADVAAHEAVSGDQALTDSVAKIQTSVDTLQTEIGTGTTASDNTAKAGDAATDNAGQASS